MITEAIVLAGGLGTRLRNVIGQFPKPMAPVNGKPFLEYIFLYLEKQGIKKVILSVGYLSEKIEEYFKSSFNNIEIVYCKEEEPLGTGGGIKKASGFSSNENIFVINGDSFFDVNLFDFFQKHQSSESILSLALKQMQNFDRYGTVAVTKEGRLTAFNEKRPLKEGLINGGVYILNKKLWSLENFPEKFSFEKDVLEKYFSNQPFYGFPFDGYFIDIGIPEDYQRAQESFRIVTK